MSSQERTIAPVLAIVSGLLILTAGGYTAAMWIYFAPWQATWGHMGGMGMMMWEFMGGMFWAPVSGIVSGVLVLIGGLMLYNNPAQSQTWGTLILVFSIMGLFGGGGFIIGTILGIVAGILALTQKS